MATGDYATLTAEFHLFGRSFSRRFAGQFQATRRVLSGRPHVVAATAFAWLPLLVLSALPPRMTAGTSAFLDDYAAHARFLVALPALLAGKGIADRLSALADSYLKRARLVPSELLAEHERVLARFVKARDSKLTAAVIVVLSYLLAGAELSIGRDYDWWKTTDSGALAPAGYWYYFVARPLLLTQLLLWLWTFALWARLLYQFAKLPLRLNPYHHDRSGGLSPALRAHGAFALLAFALSTDLAGAFANRLAHFGASVAHYQTALIVFVILLTCALLAPLLAFSSRLVAARLRGMDEHAAMSCALAGRTRDDYVHAVREGVGASLIEVISAHADAGTSADIIAKTSILPVTRQYLLLFLAAAALPLLLATLVQVPFKQVFGQLLKLVTY